MAVARPLSYSKAYIDSLASALDTRLDALELTTHAAVTLGTANGLSLVGQALSMALASGASAGAMSASDFTKLAGVSGSNTGDVTIGAYGSSPTANALSVAGQVITAQPADGSNPGSISLLAQTLGAGVKTFTSSPVMPGATGAGGSTPMTFTTAATAGSNGNAYVFDVTTDATLATNLFTIRNGNVIKVSVTGNGGLTSALSPIGGLNPSILTATISSVTTATSGGTLANSTTYSYKVAAYSVSSTNGVGLASSAVTVTTGASGSAHANTINWTAVRGATGYRIFGRVGASELLIGTVTNGLTTSFVDDGSVTPSGAQPAIDKSNRVFGAVVAVSSQLEISQGININLDGTTGSKTLSSNGTTLTLTGLSLTAPSLVLSGSITGATTIAASGAITSSVASGSVAYSQLQGARLVTNGATATRYISDDGTNVTVTGSLKGNSLMQATLFAADSNVAALLRGDIATGSSAIAVKIYNRQTLNTAGAIIAAFYADTGPTTKVCSVDILGGVRTNHGNAALPTASATYRGFIMHGPDAAGGVADKLYWCAKSAADTYSWVQVATA